MTSNYGQDMMALPQAAFLERMKCINCDGTELRELSRGHYVDEPLCGFLKKDPWGKDPMPFLQAAEWQLVRCNECSQVFHKMILNDEWNMRRFSEWMSADAILEFERRIGSTDPQRQFKKAIQETGHILRIEKLTRLVRQGNPVRLLDFGCGWGKFISACQHFGFDCVGVDRSVPRQTVSSVQIEPSLERVKGPFHAVTLFETLEHLDEPAAVLRAISPLVLKGGILVLETPDCSGVTTIGSHQDYLKIHPLEHINCFTHKTLKSIANRCGFQSIPRPVVNVTAEAGRVARSYVKSFIGKDERSTQLYFVKVD